jgi:TfoX/Sxy family transcriptional regulator of competence genes
MKKKSSKKTKQAETPELDPRFTPVVEAFAALKAVTAGKLFSSYGLKVDGKIFAMFGRGRLVVKLPKQRVDRLVSAREAERFSPGRGRLMKEWAALESGDSAWVELAREAYDFVRQGQP